MVNELRTGNIVLRKKFIGTVFKQITIDANSIQACLLHPEWFKPVELNKEWFLKLGFDVYEGWATMKESKFLKISINLKHFKTLIGDSQGVYEVKKCEYVHQVQNLYFSLTGKELKIND